MLTRFKGFSSLKAWSLKIAKKRGHKRACVAVARTLSVIMHAMWRDGSMFRFKAAETQDKQQGKRAPKLLAATA
ncbi:hypothetical protein MSC49_28360 [Methylosinus sp. C49]|uniref:hypothetical protein n=1 Tax=Methylosinus sp. C49 TaxID=2699395 RepID=UPI0013678A59|nr:hypothetical protein MSC49_28360 [Methylosinus sp. C49]